MFSWVRVLDWSRTQPGALSRCSLSHKIQALTSDVSLFVLRTYILHTAGSTTEDEKSLNLCQGFGIANTNVIFRSIFISALSPFKL